MIRSRAQAASPRFSRRAGMNKRRGLRDYVARCVFIFPTGERCFSSADRMNYTSSTASAPFTASALSVTVFSSDVACTVMFSAKNRASAT